MTNLQGLGPQDLDLIARIMVDSYLRTAQDSVVFSEQYGAPPTLMWRAHNVRSIIQARVTQTDRFELHSEFAEYGRVQITDHAADGRSFVLRSQVGINAVAQENHGRLFTGSFVSWERVPELLFVYAFMAAGLSVSLASAKRKRGAKHLEAATGATYIGTWPYTDDGDSDSAPFSQGGNDPFLDLGELTIEGDG